MGIFQKLSTLIRSNINDLISRAEDPEKMLTQVILDMRNQLARAKREVAAAIADERKLRQQADEEVKQARDWEQRAVLAVRESRDDLAKQALMRQQEHAERAQSLEQTWGVQAEEIARLKSSLRQLNDKIDEAKRKRNLLVAKQKRAQAQRRIHESMAGLSDTSAFEAFNRMAEKIEDNERRLLAENDVNRTLAASSAESEFLKLEAGQSDAAVEQRLTALKQDMGLLSAGASEGPRRLESGENPDTDAVGREGGQEPKDGSEAALLEEFERLEENTQR